MCFSSFKSSKQTKVLWVRFSASGEQMSAINMQFHPLSSPSDRTSHLISLLSLFVLSPDSLASLIHQTGLSFCFLACLRAPAKTVLSADTPLIFSTRYISLGIICPLTIRQSGCTRSSTPYTRPSYNSQEVHQYWPAWRERERERKRKRKRKKEGKRVRGEQLTCKCHTETCDRE